MTDPSRGHGGADPSPSMLDLVRLSPRRLFPPGGEALYRQIALLTGMEPDHEVLDVGCGRGVSLEYFVREYGVHGSGIEEDAQLVQLADDRARSEGLNESMQVQAAPADALPYRDEIFDIAVGELGMTAGAEPSAAVRELVRVTRPGGTVVLVQLVWKAPVDAERRAVLSEHLGVRPLMLVEWKRILREQGIQDLHTEDWTDDQTAFRPRVAKPFPDFSELFSLPEKVGILRRAWGRWGWGGVRSVLARERVVHRLLTRERILGLDLLMGTRSAVAVSADGGPGSHGEPDDDDGLPLFRGDPGGPR
jgi:ubiquinone/menaquinone biosynthesis C-methylase UbiE